MKRQNKLGSYLAVTVGAGCAASTASGAIQVIDLSGVSGDTRRITLAGGDADIDLFFESEDSYGSFTSAGNTSFYSNVLNFSYGDSAGGYQAGPAQFPLDPDDSVQWHQAGDISANFVVGLNYVAFRDSDNRFGWLSFTLNSLGINDNNPVTSYGHFVYDDASTGPSNAIPLETAIAAVPEPSSLALLALGATGLVTRRQRKKAA